MRSQVQSLIRDAYSNEDLLIINSVNEFDTYSCQEWITQGIENGDTLTYPIVDDLVADNYIFSLFVSQLTGGFPYHVVLDHNREVVLSVLGSDIYSVIGAIDDAIEAKEKSALDAAEKEKETLKKQLLEKTKRF